MKKIYAMIFVAAATLAGCQNVNDGLESDNQNKVEMKVGASVPTVSRTALTENAGVYKATWKAGDALNLVEVAGESVTTYESAALAGDTESANFSFELTAAEAESYTYLAVYPKGAVSNATANKFVVTLPATQSPAEMNTFDGTADILVSNAAESTVQGGSLALTMQRLSAVGKITVKNMPLAAGEVVKSVTFSCGHPLAGSATVNVADLTYEVKQGIGEVKVVLPESQSGEFTAYFSCLPATLAAGDAYTVSVETSAATYHKVSTVTSPLTLAAGDITSFTVNMGDAASKTKAENLNPDYVYAIGFTSATSGKTYLLNRTATTINPTGAEVASLGLSIDAKGNIVGEVPADYQWNYKKVDDKAQFYYMTGSGKECHLIMCNKAQGVAVLSKNSDGVYKGNYSNNYSDNFTITATEGGYLMQSDETRFFHYDEAYSAFRGATNASSAGNMGVVNFYRILTGAKESIYPVITEAAHVTEGTYVIMQKYSDVYYALNNDECTASAHPTVASEVSITIENGVVTAANVSDAHKWVVTKSTEEGCFNLRSYEKSNLWLWHRNNSTGAAVADVDNEGISGKYHTHHWMFIDDAAQGLQMRGKDYTYEEEGVPTTVAHNRVLRMAESEGVYFWGTITTPSNPLVLVKLSNSTEFKPQAE